MLDLEPRDATALRPRAVGATWASAGIHGAIALLLVFAVRGTPTDESNASTVRATPLAVWLDRTGPLTGGGTHGDRSREPSPRAERPGSGRTTAPAMVAASFSTAPEREPPLQEIDIPAIPEASGLREVPGDLTAVSIAISTRGPGSGPGAGSGEGSGLDAGWGGNMGGGPRGSGGGASSPELIKQVRPNYTSPALQARVRGVVVMDAVVLADGTVGDVKIVRSLDRTYGLDQEAIKAVRQWRFRPGTRSGAAVPMLVSIEMLFELR